MKHSKVRVAADINGNVIGVSQNNPEYGYVRVEQSVTQISEAGWLKPVKRSALIKGKVEDLAEAGFVEGHELSGKIIVRESLTAFNPENPDRDLKIAGAQVLYVQLMINLSIVKHSIRLIKRLMMT